MTMSAACRKQPRRLIVAFPLKALRQDSRIVDPSNTEFVSQYYLLENIARGLVQDSAASATGYRPAIAASWRQLTATRWVFALDPKAKWSDGTPLTSSQVADHLLRLKTGQYRHVVYLKRLKTAAPSGDEVHLEFSAPTDEGLLHELSLADTALLHPRNLEGDWSVGSGPYIVESYRPGAQLSLRRNDMIPDMGEAPEHVDLIDVPWDQRGTMFHARGVDLYRVPGPLFAKANAPSFSDAPEQFRGYPTSIYYFAFNPKGALGPKKSNRIIAAAAIRRAFGSLRFDAMTSEEQMIPAGFSGRLSKVMNEPAVRKSQGIRKTITIGLMPAFRSYPETAARLEHEFAQAGIKAEVSYEDGHAFDMTMENFIGNQRDALGSWSFLIQGASAPIRTGGKSLDALFHKAAAASNSKTREKLLAEVHAVVLQDAHAVPILIEPNAFLHSTRIDLTRLSRFDMRPRFNEIRWK